METYFKIVEIIIGVLNTFPEYNPSKLTYEHIATSCISCNSTKDCYIFKLNTNDAIDSLYTPWGKQPLNVSQEKDNFITTQILTHFTYINIAKNAILITHVNTQPIPYPTGTTNTGKYEDYFIFNSKLDYNATKQRINHEIQRLVSSHHLTDDFGSLDQLVSTPEDYSMIIDIIGNQNTVSSNELLKREYMKKSNFKFLHLFGLIIMTESNIYLRI
jgi:hypothetical protein